MGESMRALVALCLVLAITVNAIGDHDTVTELLQDEVKRTPTMSNGGDDTHPDAYGNMEERPEDSAPAENSDDAGPTDTQQGTGYFRDIPNAPGPRHGLPGYKESHQWETDTDMFSPLVFDWRFYRAKYLKGTEDEMTTKNMVDGIIMIQPKQILQKNCQLLTGI